MTINTHVVVSTKILNTPLTRLFINSRKNFIISKKFYSLMVDKIMPHSNRMQEKHVVVSHTTGLGFPPIRKHDSRWSYDKNSYIIGHKLLATLTQDIHYHCNNYDNATHSY